MHLQRIAFATLTVLALTAGGRLDRAEVAHALAADAGRGRWQILDPALTTPSFQRLSGLGLDKHGNIYVADRGNRRIQKLSPRGKPLAVWDTQLAGPSNFQASSGMAVDGSGNAYVLDRYGGPVQKISRTGRPVEGWGGENLNNEIAVAVGPHDSVSVLEATVVQSGPPGAIVKYEVIQLSAAGKRLARWSTSADPEALAVDSKGNTYVSSSFADFCDVRGQCESYHFFIQRYSPRGKLLASWEAHDGFDAHALAVDARGNLLAADGNRLQQRSPTGEVIATWSWPRAACSAGWDVSGLAADRHGNIYVADSGNETIRKFSPSGKALATWGACPTPASAPFQYPTGLAVDRQDNLFVADPVLGEVRKLSSKGKSIDGWRKSTGSASGVGVDGQGNIYVLGASLDGIRKFAPSGEELGHAGFSFYPNTYYLPLLAVDQQGMVYAVNPAQAAIHRFSSSLQSLGHWGEQGGGRGQFQNPSAVATDAAGNVYVADTGNDRIQKLSPVGKPLARWGRAGEGPGEFNAPEGVAVDSHNNVYVADTSNHRIQKFSPSGRPLAWWGTEGSRAGQFERPTGIAVDRHGNVYVADTGNARIQKLTVVG